MNMRWCVGIGETLVLVILLVVAVAHPGDGPPRSRDRHPRSMHRSTARDSADDASPSSRRRSRARDDGPRARRQDWVSRRAPHGRFGGGGFGAGGPLWLHRPWSLENRRDRFSVSGRWRGMPGRRYGHGLACRHRRGYGHQVGGAWNRSFHGPEGWRSRFARHHGWRHGRGFGRRTDSERWHGGYGRRWRGYDHDR